METYTSNYNFQKVFALLFGLVFLGFSIFGLIRPDLMTTTVNGKEVETTFLTILPGFVMGSSSLALFIWMTKNYFSIKMDEQGIIVHRNNADTRIHWNEIEAINQVNWLWKGTIFRVKPKGLKRFYFHADKPRMDFNTIWRGGFRTEMSKFIAGKKKELGI